MVQNVFLRQVHQFFLLWAVFGDTPLPFQLQHPGDHHKKLQNQEIYQKLASELFFCLLGNNPVQKCDDIVFMVYLQLQKWPRMVTREKIDKILDGNFRGVMGFSSVTFNKTEIQHN